MVASDGGIAVTVTVAVPEIAPLVALTVLVNVPATAPAVKRPVAALMLPPPFTTDQTGEIGKMLPSPSRPTAVNCCVPLVWTEAGFGVTVMVASDRGKRGHGSRFAVAKPETVPLVALTVLVNVPATAPAVKRPVLASMVPPPHDRPHGRDQEDVATGILADRDKLLRAIGLYGDRIRRHRDGRQRSAGHDDRCEAGQSANACANRIGVRTGRSARGEETRREVDRAATRDDRPGGRDRHDIAAGVSAHRRELLRGTDAQRWPGSA